MKKKYILVRYLEPDLVIKGGCANLGYGLEFTQHCIFYMNFLTVDELKNLLPDLKEFKIERYELSNIKSLNFYIYDILQDGVLLMIEKMVRLNH